MDGLANKGTCYTNNYEADNIAAVKLVWVVLLSVEQATTFLHSQAVVSMPGQQQGKSHPPLFSSKQLRCLGREFVEDGYLYNLLISPCPGL